jgi:peptidoglycan/xylan/chitin deacetylase (PgdA/CDA1 family)
LTFDDGIRNVLTTAAPYLADKELPASLFVITDRVDARCGSTGSAEWSPADDAASLSWPETEELHRIFGFEIGSHSGSHADLAALSRDEAAHELRRSNDAIKDRLGAERLSLAYPYGRYSAGVMAQARDTGYRCGLTTSGGPNRATTDTFELRRTLIGDGDDEATFAARVAGVTHILTVVATTGRRALAPMARR